MQTVFSTSDIAALLGCKPWQVRRVFENGAIDSVPRIGRHRAIPASLLPAIIDALRDRDWLPAVEHSGQQNTEAE